MKTIKLLPLALITLFAASGCNSSTSGKTIIVGATPNPHAQILNSSAVTNYVRSKGYTLEVKVYQDYGTLNNALNSGGLDANYFQHIPYLTQQCEEKGYVLSAACTVHNEPLNLYGKTKITDFSGQTINIINDVANVERAFILLKDNDIIDSYSVEDFDAQHPVYTSSIGVTIQCIDSGLLTRKVEEGGYAVIPGNYALVSWSTEVATSYKVFGESEEVAYPNVIAVRSADITNEKTNILVEALGQEGVKTFIESTFGPTVNYSYLDLRK